MRITIFRRLRKDRRGVSNIIVVALSLVIMLAIVSDIVLWNYEMTQVDWEKMKEDVKIISTKSSATPSWITTQTEYTVNTGTKTSGSYPDTRTKDGTFERFTESVSGTGGNVTLINNESFEGTWPPSGWTETGNWNKENNYAHDGSFSADFDGLSSGTDYLVSPVLDCSGADVIYVDFWWHDRTVDNDDVYLEYYDGVSWITIQDLNQLAGGNGWHHYAQGVTNTQYFVSNFQVRWRTNQVNNGVTICIDQVTVKKEFSGGIYSLDVSGQFLVDLSVYQPEHIQTIELQLLYRASDATDNWYLQAYNWDSSIYSDNGFNVTSGHTPTTGWDYFTVNFSDVWQDYVDDDGTINVKLKDQNGDAIQTSIDVDFLGINVKTDGTEFTFKNEGSLTAHLVSLWITNSTHHQRYDLNAFLNSGATKNYVNYDVALPAGSYIVKVVTERGNTAVFSGN